MVTIEYSVGIIAEVSYRSAIGVFTEEHVGLMYVDEPSIANDCKVGAGVAWIAQISGGIRVVVWCVIVIYCYVKIMVQWVN